MTKTVFIHTNAKQMAGAIVGKHSLKRNSADPDAFDVQIAAQEDFPVFSDFGGLKPVTKLIHNAKRRTQPLKSGLPIDFTNRPNKFVRLLGISGYKKKGHYRRHPDPRQEKFFFSLLKDSLDAGEITDEQITAEMALNHIRHDAFDVMDKAPAVDLLLNEVGKAA